MSTPHNAAKKGDIAETVLMPGDPLRAKFIAETFLENAVCTNTIRGMLGYTGTYNGKKVSVMGSGMGMPSIGIYSWELFTVYDVKNIIRVGTTGAYNPDLNLFDVCIADKAYSESTFAKVSQGYKPHTIKPSKELNSKLIKAAKAENIKLHKAMVHSSDVFYFATDEAKALRQKLIEEKKLDVVEMESFALFANAFILGKNAACLLTVSDSLAKGTETTPEERQTAFTNMMKIALRAATA